MESVQLQPADVVVLAASLRALLAEIDAGRIDASVAERARIEGAVVVVTTIADSVAQSH